MNYIEIVSTVYESIRANPVRSFLTSFGVTAGVAAVVALVGLISGLGGFIEDEFEGMLNSNTFEITRSNPGPMDLEELNRSRSWPDVSIRDAEELAILTDSICIVSWKTMVRGSVVYLDQSALGVSITGCTARSREVEGIALDDGRFFTSEEEHRGARVCILGAELAEDLGITGSALGVPIQVRGSRFYVIGIEEASGSAFGFGLDNGLRIPFSTLENLFGNGSQMVISALPVAGITLDRSMEYTISAMRSIRGLTLDQEDNFYTITQEGALASIDEILGAVGAITIGIAAISLLVGGIGIMNITLVSVTERTREIGTRRALGATRNDIVIQFMLEATGVSVLGGLIGFLIGALIIMLVATSTPIPASITLWSVLVALGFSGLIGLIFGIYPAWKAAGLSPVEALRYE